MCAAVLAGAGASERDDVKLPDIGSSAAGLVSPEELRDYGAAMLQAMRAYDIIEDDPLLSDYINALGWKLVANSERPDISFYFFTVRDDQINAFAAPGGFVGVNAGLITAMRTEDELAGVLAHEISHVQQQHILRAFEDQQKMSVPILLGMLGVAIAGAHASNGQASSAALVVGQSIFVQRQINFTRSQEAEADRIGIQTLARSGFDPNAMAGAFQTLQTMMRVNGVDVPEFLLDHPLDTKRIAEAKARAEQIGCPHMQRIATTTRPSAPTGQLDLGLPTRPLVADSAPSVDNASAKTSAMDAAGDTTTMTVEPGSGHGKTLPQVSVKTCTPRPQPTIDQFEMMRERVRVLTATSAPAIRAYYADNLRDDKTFDTLANRYGYALALISTHMPQQAATELRKLVAQYPTSSILRLALANAQDQSGDKSGALKIYEQLNSDFPGNRAITLTYADALMARTDPPNARRALDLLRTQVERHSDDPDLQKSYGRANELAGDKVRAAEAFADAAYLTGHAEDALNQLKALSKQPNLTYYQRSRIDARIAELTPKVLELRKRNSPQPKSLALACCSPG
ncbi:MAG: M48 family metalloprotease [Rhodanobacter sp.]|jgi:predicted Zn-dependent protease|nr:M48 family metalloprotease [Rhodanobacter sp.]